jgi:hypothetical protein
MTPEVKNLKLGFIPTTISKTQAEGTGMAMVLILLLLGQSSENNLYFKIAIGVLLVNMVIPKIYYPLAIVWFSLSNLLSKVMPNIIMTLVYLSILVPVGVARKMMGYDPLLLKQWKKNTDSVFKIRTTVYQASDLEKPY